MAGRMAVLRGGDLNGPASPRQRWSVPQHNTQRVGVQAARPTPGPQSLAGPTALLDSAGRSGLLRFAPARPPLTASRLDSGDGRSA